MADVTPKKYLQINQHLSNMKENSGFLKVIKLVQDETQKLRKLRLQQVREQEKALANRIRKKFKEKEKQELNVLGNQLKREWEDKITEKRNVLENLYLENVRHVGEGHQAALMREDDGAPKTVSLEEEIKVAHRYKQAIKKLKADEAERTRLQQERTEAKHKAMEIERIRAARVAALDPPVPDIARNLEMIKTHKYKQKSIDQYSSTYYHLPQELVEKADPNDEQVDARDAAREEEERIRHAKEDADRNFSEQMEKARLRHKHARSRLLLQKDHDQLLEELEYFERVDRQRRQDIVSKIPKHVFEPPHRRMESQEERQREMEHAFEDMYMAQTNYMGDVSVAREPFSASPDIADEDQDLTTETEDESVLPAEPKDVEIGKGVHDAMKRSERLPKAAKGDGSAIPQVEHLKESAELAKPDRKEFIGEGQETRREIKPSSKDPLRRLMKKIDVQRDRWRSKMRSVKDNVELHDVESTILDSKASEISEGPLTVTTEKTPSDESDVFVKPKETLLHPNEEAEMTRAAASQFEAREIKHPSTDIEARKQLLQQQKLKLQLQQQQVLQEHLQLQFDMLQHEIETTSKDGEIDEESSTTKPIDTLKNLGKDHMTEEDEKLSSRLDSLSSGLLSEEGKLTSESNFFHDGDTGAGSEEVLPASPSNEVHSRVDVNLRRQDELSSIPESVVDDHFVALTPAPPAADFAILPQPTPLHVEVPTSLYSDSKIRVPVEVPSTVVPLTTPLPLPEGRPKSVDGFELDPIHTTSRLSAFPSNEPLFYSRGRDTVPTVEFPPQELSQVSGSTDVDPTFNLATSVASKTPSSRIQLPRMFQLPDDAGTDTASYIKFYQQQLVEQQGRIREQQRAIQERQQQRLKQLKQFQDRLRALRINSSPRLYHDPHGSKHVTDPSAHWRSLVPTSLAGYTESSSTYDTQSDMEPRSVESDNSQMQQHFPGKERASNLSKTASDGDDTTSSSLRRYPSDIVPPRKFDEQVLFPEASELGLWSDTTVQLSSDATKSSSCATFQESNHTMLGKETSSQDMGNKSEISSSSFSAKNDRHSSDMNRSSGTVSTKSKNSLDSGPLSLSSLAKSDKTLSSSDSDANNNLLVRTNSSFQHFEDMIEEAKMLSEKYLRISKQAEEDPKKRSFKSVAGKEDSAEGELADLTKIVSDSFHQHQQQVLSDIRREARGNKDNFSRRLIEDDERTPIEVNTAKRRSEDFYKPLETIDDPYRSTLCDSAPDCILRVGNDADVDNIQDENVEDVFSSPEHRPFTTRNDGNLVLTTETHFMDCREENVRSYETSRTLSVIPEETLTNDDDLSEGIIEDDEDNPDKLNSPEHRQQDFYKPLEMVNNDDATGNGHPTPDVLHSQKDNDVYDFPDEGSEDAFNFPEHGTLTSQDKDNPLQGSAYEKTESYVSENFPDNGPVISIPCHLESHQTEEWCQSPEANPDLSENRSPFESYSLENDPLSKLMDTSESFAKLRLQTVPSTHDDKSFLEISESSGPAGDVVFPGHSLSPADVSPRGNIGMSLQEAFQKNRPRFVENSKQRVRAAKEARFRQPRHRKFQNSTQRSRENRSRLDTENNEGRISQASSVKELKLEELGGTKRLNSKQKIDKQDIIAPSKRLYQNLPDVRNKKYERQREEMNAANNAKAREFQKQTRERLRKLNEKKTGRKKDANSS